MSKKYLEIYNDLIENPKWTPLGYPIVTITNNACVFASEEMVDCWTCPHYKPAGKEKPGSAAVGMNKIK